MNDTTTHTHCFASNLPLIISHFFILSYWSHRKHTVLIEYPQGITTIWYSICYRVYDIGLRLLRSTGNSMNPAFVCKLQ